MRRGRGEAAASSELKRKIKNEIREVTVENIMKYINLGKAAQWVIKSEIGRRGQGSCSRIDHECIRQRRQREGGGGAGPSRGTHQRRRLVLLGEPAESVA